MCTGFCYHDINLVFIRLWCTLTDDTYTQGKRNVITDKTNFLLQYAQSSARKSDKITMATGVTPLQLSLQVQKYFPCNICEDGPEAYWSCNKCGQNLCDDCKKKHSRNSFTKNHRVVPILERTEAGKDNANICKSHDEPHIFFCLVCRTAICAKCQAGKHSGHDVEELGSHSDTIRSAVDINIREKRAAIEDSREKLSRVSDKIWKLQAKFGAEIISNLKENLDRLV